MRRPSPALMAALLVIGLSTPLVAGEIRRQFVVRVARDQPELAERLNAQLPGWVSAVKTELRTPDGWDDTAAGPFDLVLARVTVRLEKPSDSTARIRLSMDDTGLRSGKTSMEALTRAVAGDLLQRAGAAALEETATRRAVLEGSVADATRRQRTTEADLRALEEEHGDPTVARGLIFSRLREAQGELADARIQEAVLGRQVVRARLAAKRALEVAKLERAVAAIEAVIEAAIAEGRAVPAERTEKLAELQKELDEARAETPSIDTVRERIFDLEVALTAEEGRVELLGEEIAALRQSSAGAMRADRRHRELLEDLATRRARRSAAVRALEELDRRAVAPPLELLGRPTPDTDHDHEVR